MFRFPLVSSDLDGKLENSEGIRGYVERGVTAADLDEKKAHMMNPACKTESFEDVNDMTYEHECMEPAEDAPAPRALLENDCGRSGLFVLMVAGISHSYVRVDNIFKE